MEVLETLDGADPRLQLPNHALIVGMSMSGKTRLVIRLLQEITLFNPKPTRVIFAYDQYQDIYADVQRLLQSQGIQMILKQGSNFKLDDFEKVPGQTLLIIDDATEETSSSNEIAKLFTNGRHKNLSVWLIWHTLYSKHPASRLMMQNVSYVFLLPSVRLTSQVYTLDNQLRLKGLLATAYKCACEMHADHRYLLLDIGPNAIPSLRLRSQIHENVQVAYI